MLHLFKMPSIIYEMAKVRSKGAWGGARPNPGPKPKPPGERRRNRIMLNLTDQEYSKLLKAAGGTQYASRYVRDALLRHLNRRKS